ncbi:hypothetical protein U9M48_022322 [Paspalum notatum var. saurae]|uniref:Uncharacterized protein n=1 Tax=Paspalum notatum var. saurae TaxID=547442 RepID=A0AAQ3THF8_PASNO
MHRQLSSLASSPRQQQPQHHQQDDGIGIGIGIGIGGDAAQAMAVTEDESASHSKADRARLARDERTIHLIPILTFLCFLLLFLCSHDPTPSDMSSFAGGDAGGVISGNRRLRMM